MAGRVRISRKTQESFRAAAAKVVAAAKAMDPNFARALRGIGEEIMTDVKASRPGHGVPVDEGTLRASGRVDSDRGDGRDTMGKFTSANKVQVTLSFGGAAAPYALVQHENVQYHHTVGEARYLVRGLERWTPASSHALAALRARAQAVLHRGGGRP